MEFFYDAKEVKVECESHDSCISCKIKRMCNLIFAIAPQKLPVEDIQKKMDEYQSGKVEDEDTEDLYKELRESKGYVSVSELVERFAEVDEYFMKEPWNLKQILANINMLIPIEIPEEDGE